MREKRDITLQISEFSDQPICSVGNLIGRFAARTSVLEDIPFSPPIVNVYRALTLVITVVPLRQIGFDFRGLPQAGQLTGSLSTL